MLTGKYSGPNAMVMPEGDHRHARFNRPDVKDGLNKLTELNFLQTPERSMVQSALRFVLDHPGVSCVISGAKTRQQAEENAGASDLPSLTQDELARALPLADAVNTPNWSS
jgi:aryl-alcohol dehydrogenase-like predicted oxidoreductase